MTSETVSPGAVVALQGPRLRQANVVQTRR